MAGKKRKFQSLRFFSFASLTQSNLELCVSGNGIYPLREVPPLDEAVRAVEKIIGYDFKNKKLLEEALTHPSFGEAASYQRLEFLGDAALGLVVSNHIFLANPTLDPGQLSAIRAANISTEKLARVAVRHRLYNYVRRNAAALDEKVREFAETVSVDDDDAVVYGGSIKAPKVLADIVESIAAAIYVDVNFDLQELWVIFRGLLEPIVTHEDLQKQPQPVTVLFEQCQKLGKSVDIKHWRNGSKGVASVYVDGKFVASSSSEQKDIAKLDAAKLALYKLSNSMPTTGELCHGEIDGSFEIQAAKQKLHELCGRKKWPKPIYNIDKDKGPAHEKKFITSVQIPTENGKLMIQGDEKTRLKDAENSAASYMIRALRESNFL